MSGWGSGRSVRAAASGGGGLIEEGGGHVVPGSVALGQRGPMCGGVHPVLWRPEMPIDRVVGEAEPAVVLAQNRAAGSLTTRDSTVTIVVSTIVVPPPTPSPTLTPTPTPTHCRHRRRRLLPRPRRPPPTSRPRHPPRPVSQPPDQQGHILLFPWVSSDPPRAGSGGLSGWGWFPRRPAGRPSGLLRGFLSHTRCGRRRHDRQARASAMCRKPWPDPGLAAPERDGHQLVGALVKP